MFVRNLRVRPIAASHSLVTGQVVWVVPKSSLLASSSSDPRTPPTPGSSTSASAAPTLLLSPTFILPCGVASGSGHGAADDAAEATTEW